MDFHEKKYWIDSYQLRTLSSHGNDTRGFKMHPKEGVYFWTVITKHKKLKLNLERCNRGFCKLGSLFTQRNKEKYMLEHGSCLRLHLPFCIGAQWTSYSKNGDRETRYESPQISRRKVPWWKWRTGLEVLYAGSYDILRHFNEERDKRWNIEAISNEKYELH